MVSPAASPEAPASASALSRAKASSTPARIRSWSARIGSSSCSGWAISAALLVVPGGDGPELRGFLLGRRVVEEVPAADLGAGQVLQQTRLPERRKDLDVEVKARIGAAIGRRLVQDHHVGERHPPEVLQPDQGLPQDRGEGAA